MQVPLFNGGLNTRLDASLINPNEAVRYINIDNTPGTLSSAKSYTTLATLAPNPNIYLFKGVLFSSTADRDYIEYNDKLYWSETNGTPAKYDTTQAKLGIDSPVSKPAVDSLGLPVFNDSFSQIQGLYPTYIDFVEDDFLLSLQVVNGDMSAGTKEYRIFVYEDSKLIFTFDKSQTVGDDSAIIFNFKTDHVIKVGRLDSGDYYLIGNVKGREVIDNNQAIGAEITDVVTTDTIVTQWTYTYYNELDGTESAPAVLTDEYSKPYDKKVLLNNLTFSADQQVTTIRIYRLNEGITEPSLIMEIPNVPGFYYDYTPTLAVTSLLDSYNNIPPLPGLKYLTEAYGIFFGANGNKLFWSEIGNANYWPAANGITFGFEITGILPIYTGILVFGKTKTDLLVGTVTEEFRRETISKNIGCTSHKSCKLINFYPSWVSLDGITTISNGSLNVVSKDKLGSINISVKNSVVQDDTYWILKTDGSLLAMDLRFGIIFKEFEFDKPLTDLTVFDNEIYSTVEGSLVTVFTGERLKIKYLSPAFSEGANTMTKLYNNIYIKYNGEFIVNVLIDGKQVHSKVLNPDELLEDLKVPEEFQRGTNIQFDVEGFGTIHEIEYKAMERVNGR